MTLDHGSESAAVIGILVCDHIGPELRDASGGRDYGDMYAEFLAAAEPALATRVYDVVGGEVPGSPGECDGWIITGSRHDAFGDDAWVEALRNFIVDVGTAGARLVGVCFGHQAVASALGGEVGRAGEWKVGPQRLTVESTPWFDGGEVAVHAMHQDVVGELPPGARSIGAGSTAEHPMFVLEDTILCIQDHPEFDERYMRALIDARRDRFGDELAESSLQNVDDVATHSAVIGRWLVDFLLDRRSAEG